ncbi:uncharacterized protein LOC143928250 [Lithobates pipiens]
MLPFLSRYPDRVAARLLAEGFREGFRIPCDLKVVPPVARNLRSALQHPTVVDEKLGKEVALGRMGGPFTVKPWDSLVVSPLGVVPKKEPGKFRLIHHLSFPKGGSVNDFIDPDVCAVSYTSFDAAVRWVRRYGRGALMAKADIESAFRLLPVHPDSFRWLGCHWREQFYVDKCLPMGCSVSCSVFEQFSSFLEWVVRDVSGIESIIHYLDDFLCIGPHASAVCAILLSTLQHIAGVFGVPLAAEKTEGPVGVLSFLGIVIDSAAMECRLPDDKLADLQRAIREIQGRRKVQLTTLQSLLGKLNFACRIIPMGRVFCRRLSAATAGVRAPTHFIRLTEEHRDDLGVWHDFLSSYNGRAVWMSGPVSNFDVALVTDAAGSTGYGAFFQGRWSAEPWPRSWKEAGFLGNLVLLELFPIVLALELWGESCRNLKLRINCDNMGVVQVVNRMSASSPPVIRLLRQLVLRCLRLNVFLYAVHIPGVENALADSLSRFQWDKFRELAPGAEAVGIPCPGWIWALPLESPRAGYADGGSPRLVWIVGHSYVCWGARRGDMRPAGRQLGISRAEAELRWLGIPGMRWERVVSVVERFVWLHGPPDVLVLHAGGNDLGARKVRDLLNDIKADFLKLRARFPSTILLWSDIVARTQWRWARSVASIQKTRIRVNKVVGRFVIQNGGLVIRHRELESNVGLYLRGDGVHLTDVGIDLWSLGLQGGIQQALRVWGCPQG